MSESYNSVPPPASLTGSTSGDSSKGQDSSFLDAIAKARAIAAKVKEQHAGKLDSDESQSRKRALSPDRDSASGSSHQQDIEREVKRLISGQDQLSGAARYGMGADHINSVLAPLYGPGSVSSNETEEFTVPTNLVGLIIGRSGDSLKRIQSLSGAKINFDQDPIPGELERKTFVSGSRDSIQKAREMIDQLIQNHLNGRASGNGFNDSSRGSGYLPMGSQETQVSVPGNRVGLIIGRGGETIRELMEHSGARINVVQDNSIPHGTNVERLVNISGTPDCIDRAKTLVMAIVSGEINTSRGSLALQIEGAGIRFGQDKVTLQVPCEKVGLLIGRGGETIKYLQQQSRARIIIEVPESDPPPAQRNIIISGAHESVEYAKTLIYEKLDGLNGITSQDGSSSYNEYGFPPTAPYMQQYGGYPYYPTAMSGYGYPTATEGDPSQSSGDGTKAEGSESNPDGTSAHSEQDMKAFNDYYKQCQEYYAAYYSSLGYSYPPAGTEGYPATDSVPASAPSPSSQPPPSEPSH